ncbi:hypothetical protein OXYTRIMIC_180 [Oxytricha trifallax]|uniref:Ubiquitin-like protease family profile domain-containing protein n=1 Tax=Oxytricha trifallax TaxID=1172189 RepID=A0A073I038_9SPIT|nr:hypothetical protein OXYTRIMIC_180 [Oxytricha trifallax]
MESSQFNKKVVQRDTFMEDLSSRRRDNKKNRYLERVDEIRFDHRDRSKDWEALGFRSRYQEEIPLNKQMGFKNKLKIGKSNPSKKLNEPQKQRSQTERHVDGSICVQSDQMKLKNLLDLAEVTCKDFEKIIYAKKGWEPMVTRIVVVVCCPSTRNRIEKALVRKFEDRKHARRRGVREDQPWSEKQRCHWEEINQEWRHDDMIPGNHIMEITMESCTKQIEELQSSLVRMNYLILPPIIMREQGIAQMKKTIGTMNWKLDNSKYWREMEEIEGIIIPVCFQGSVKNCQNWVVMKIEKQGKVLEVYDPRRQVGSLAILQKNLRRLNEVIIGTMGKDYEVKKIATKADKNQCMLPEDCGIIALLIINHLVLELPGEPVFQIFVKDWIQMQRQHMMLNLEVGYMKMEIGKSGFALRKEEMLRVQEQQNESMWMRMNDEVGSQSYTQAINVDTWDEMVLENFSKTELEKAIDREGREINEIGDEVSEIEECLFTQNPKKRKRENSLMKKKREEDSIGGNRQMLEKNVRSEKDVEEDPREAEGKKDE